MSTRKQRAGGRGGFSATSRRCWCAQNGAGERKPCRQQPPRPGPPPTVRKHGGEEVAHERAASVRAKSRKQLCSCGSETLWAEKMFFSPENIQGFIAAWIFVDTKGCKGVA